MNASFMSKYVIAYFDSKGEPITNKKLQKLLYYIEAWHLVLSDSIIDEDFQAWVHGPVVPDVYHEFKEFGYRQLSLVYDKNISASNFIKKLIGEQDILSKNIELLNEILEKYGSLSAFQLEFLTHSEDPWNIARKGYGELDACNEIIDKKLMREYYSKLLEDEQKN